MKPKSRHSKANSRRAESDQSQTMNIVGLATVIGTIVGVIGLIVAILSYIDNHNAHPNPPASSPESSFSSTSSTEGYSESGGIDSEDEGHETPTPSDTNSNTLDYVSENLLCKVITEKSGKEVVYHYYTDYNADGYCETFAVVGNHEVEYSSTDTIDTFEYYCGEIWFADQRGALVIEDTDDLIHWMSPHVVRIGNQVIFCIERVWPTGSRTVLWSVTEKGPQELGLSSKGSQLQISTNTHNEIEITHTDYDFAESTLADGKTVLAGRTSKEYYLYYDGEEIREYGGMLISEEDLLRIPNIGTIWTTIDWTGKTIESIYYRENGIININYSFKDSSREKTYKIYQNITLRVDSDIQIVKSKYDTLEREGFYLEAIYPELASYPKSFPY